MGHSPSGLFGYSHMLGGYPGGQAQYLRVPHADVGPIKIESDLPDEKVLFLSDIYPTGYMAAEQANIQPGDTVAIWGCGPVGQFVIRSAWMLGAGRVIAIDEYQNGWPWRGPVRRKRSIRVPKRFRVAERNDEGSGSGTVASMPSARKPMARMLWRKFWITPRWL